MSTTRSFPVRAARLGAVLLAGLAWPAAAQLTPEWITQIPVGTSMNSGFSDFVIDEDGVAYLSGTTGSSMLASLDAVVAAVAPDGTVLWQRTFNGPLNGFDVGSGIALGPDGVLYVTGQSEGLNSFASVLLLKYAAATGTLLDSTVYASAPNTSEAGGAVAVDAQGGVYLGCSTGGDGTDAMILKYDAALDLQWKRTWDGAAFEPYTLDSVRDLAIDPNGDVIVLIHGVTGSNQPDFVVVKYAPDTGATIWTRSWGDNGGDTPRSMELDATGDIYVSGTSGFFEGARFATIRLRNSDGALLWQAFDKLGYHDSAIGLALDGKGGVYVTGRVDPDTDISNDNDNIWTFKRTAEGGALQWTHLYGSNAKWNRDEPSDVVVDLAGHVFVGGYTNSPPYQADVITLVLDATSGAEVDRQIIDGGPNMFMDSGLMAFDAEFNLFNAAEPGNITTGQTLMSLTKFTTLVGTPYQLNLPLLVGGTGATFAVQNGTPLGAELIAFSLAGTASIPIPALGATLGLKNAQLLVLGTADALGTFAVGLHIPAAAFGVTAWFQGLQFNGATPVVKRTVQ